MSAIKKYKHPCMCVDLQQWECDVYYVVLGITHNAKLVQRLCETLSPLSHTLFCHRTHQKVPGSSSCYSSSTIASISGAAGDLMLSWFSSVPVTHIIHPSSTFWTACRACQPEVKCSSTCIIEPVLEWEQAVLFLAVIFAVNVLWGPFLTL